jgi:Ner family transcriptional regulator
MRAALRRHERIKMRLRLKGSSLAQIARELGVTPTTVTIVSQGFRRSRRIEMAIATHLDVAPAQLWPERYVQVTHVDIRGMALMGA